MTKEELIEFLKENLEVRVYVLEGFHGTKIVRVQTYLGDEILSEDEDGLD